MAKATEIRAFINANIENANITGTTKLPELNEILAENGYSMQDVDDSLDIESDDTTVYTKSSLADDSAIQRNIVVEDLDIFSVRITKDAQRYKATTKTYQDWSEKVKADPTLVEPTFKTYVVHTNGMDIVFNSFDDKTFDNLHERGELAQFSLTLNEEQTIGSDTLRYDLSSPISRSQLNSFHRAKFAKTLMNLSNPEILSNPAIVSALLRD